jgi:hypothetical protein
MIFMSKIARQAVAHTGQSFTILESGLALARSVFQPVPISGAIPVLVGSYNLPTTAVNGIVLAGTVSQTIPTLGAVLVARHNFPTTAVNGIVLAGTVSQTILTLGAVLVARHRLTRAAKYERQRQNKSVPSK